MNDNGHVAPSEHDFLDCGESVTFCAWRSFLAQSGNTPSAFAHESRPWDSMSGVAFVAPVAPSVSTVAKHDLRGAQFSKGPALVSGYSEDPSVSCFNWSQRPSAIWIWASPYRGGGISINFADLINWIDLRMTRYRIYFQFIDLW